MGNPVTGKMHSPSWSISARRACRERMATPKCTATASLIASLLPSSSSRSGTKDCCRKNRSVDSRVPEPASRRMKRSPCKALSAIRLRPEKGWSPGAISTSGLERMAWSARSMSVGGCESTYRSSRFSRRRCTTRSRLSTSSEMSMPGCCSQKLPSSRGTKYLAVLTTAIRRRPRVSPLRALICCSNPSHSSMMARAVQARRCPASVRWILRATTSYTGRPTDSLISRNCIEAVGCVTCMARAAPLTLPVSARAMKRRNCRKVMFIRKNRYIHC